MINLGTNNRIKLYLFFIFLSFSLLIPLIANPGYYNHDELQFLDFLSQHGFGEYFHQYIRIYSGEHFGVPVRPLSFFVIGILYNITGDQPFYIHLFSVLVHSIVTFLLFETLIILGANFRLSIISSIIFVINPLSVLAVGWSGAIMDQLYILFGLAAFLMSAIFVRNRSNYLILFGIFIFSTLAILSKETAAILPGLIFILWLLNSDSFKSKYFWLAFAAWCIPVFLFIIIRLPALLSSLGGSTSTYSVSLLNIPSNILIYFSFPFLVTLQEAVNWIFLNQVWVWGAVGLHLLLVSSIYRIYGIKAFSAYVYLYFLFLIPVLTIMSVGSHYLYGTSIILSCGLAAILVKKGEYLSSLFLGLICLGLLIFHSYVIQSYIYTVGACMNRILVSTEVLFISSGQPKHINFQSDPDAQKYLLGRAFAGRTQIGALSLIKFSFSNEENEPLDGVLNLSLNKNCLLYKKNASNISLAENFISLILNFTNNKNVNRYESLKSSLSADEKGYFNSNYVSGLISYEPLINKQYILISGVSETKCEHLIKAANRNSVELRVGSFGNILKQIPNKDALSNMCKSGNIWFTF